MKLLQLLTSLSKEEIKLLRKAVASPLYSTNAKVLQLYELLRPQYPNFDGTEKGKSKLFKKIFGTAKYNDYKLRRLFSELTQVVENFLIFQDLEVEKVERQKCLITAYNKRGLYTFFKKETDDLLVEIEKSPYRNDEYFSDKIELLKPKYFHPNQNKYNIKDDTLNELANHLDTFFSLSKAQIAILLKNEEQILNRQYSYTFLSTIETENITGLNQPNILIDLYFQSFYLLTQKIEVDFSKFEIQLFETFSSLPPLDRQIIFENGLNHIIRQNNRGNPLFDAKLIFKWNLFGLKNNIFIENGAMNETVFNNIIVIACLVEQYDWIKEFIKEYKSIVDTADMDSNMAYYEGFLQFSKKDFDKALATYSTFQPSPKYNLQVRGVILKCLFEKFLQDDSYYDSLVAGLSSFDIYLKRNDYYSTVNILRYQNFIKIVQTIVSKLNLKAPPIAIKKWFEQNNQEANFYSKQWIIEKIENL